MICPLLYIYVSKIDFSVKPVCGGLYNKDIFVRSLLFTRKSPFNIFTNNGTTELVSHNTKLVRHIGECSVFPSLPSKSSLVARYEARSN